MEAAVEKTHGTAVLTCRNHPTYRWTQTKYSLPGVERRYMGSGVLMFDGEEGGKPACPFRITARRVATMNAEDRKVFLSAFTPECNCPAGDLEFLRWAD